MTDTAVVELRGVVAAGGRLATRVHRGLGEIVATFRVALDCTPEAHGPFR